MTGLEVVGLWSSIVVGLIGGTLAVVAIIFTRSVDKQSNTLNQSFIEALTSINEKSENTERQINLMVSRLVDAFLVARGIPQAAEAQEPEEGEGAGGEDTSSELRRFMARTNRSLEEIRLRQKVQAPAALSGLTHLPPGTRIQVIDGPQSGTLGRIHVARRMENNMVLTYDIRRDDGVIISGIPTAYLEALPPEGLLGGPLPPREDPPQSVAS